MRYFHESHCRLNFHVVNRCYFSDVLQHSNAKTWLDSWSWKQHVAIFGWRIGASSQEKKSEAGEKQAKYEKADRWRAFLSSWQKNRPWLKFVPASLSASATSQTASAGGNMFCEICQSASQLDRSLAQKNVFVDAGCTSLRLESIKIHETSSNHLKAITIVAAKSEPEKTPASKMICSLNKDTLEKLIKKQKGFLTCSHSVAFFYL